MEGWFLLNVVVSKCPTIFQLLSCKDEALLVWWNTFFVLDLSLDGLDGIGTFYVKSDGFSSQGLDEDLHSTA